MMQITKMYEETKKEKDAMVMKYAMSEQKRSDSPNMLLSFYLLMNTRILKRKQNLLLEPILTTDVLHLVALKPQRKCPRVK